MKITIRQGRMVRTDGYVGKDRPRLKWLRRKTLHRLVDTPAGMVREPLASRNNQFSPSPVWIRLVVNDTLMDVTSATDFKGPMPRPKLTAPFATIVGLIVCVAATIRFALVSSDLPYITNPDEPVNLGVGQKMAAHGTLLPHFYHYPSMLFDVIAIVVQIGGHSMSTGTAALLHRQNLGVTRTGASGTVLSLRLITVALSVGICVVVALVVRRLTESWVAALVAGLLLAISPLAVQNGVLVTPDTYSGFFAALALAGALRVASSGETRDYLLTGAAVGATAGAKYNAGLVIFALFVAHLLYYGRLAAAKPALQRLMSSLGTVVAVFVLITPGILFDPHRAFRDIRFEMHHYATGHAGNQGHSGSFYSGTLFHTECALMLLGAVGLLAVVATRYRKPVLVISAFAVPYFLFIGSQLVHFSRNLLPLLPAIGMLAGVGAARLVTSVAMVDTRGRRLLAATTAVAGVVVLVGFISQTVLIRAFLAQPARAQARTWLYEHVPARSVVKSESYAPYLDRRYRLMSVPNALGSFPRGAAAVIVTQLADGPYIDDPRHYVTDAAAYKQLESTSCLGAHFHDGPWISIYVPCPAG